MTDRLPTIGDVVVATLGGTPTLCCVIAETWNDPNRRGHWFGVAANHQSHWIQGQDITDRHPLCYACGARGRLFQDREERLRCAACGPPFEWAEAWQAVLSNLEYLPRDPRLAQPALALCETAFAHGDAAAFQRGLVRLQWAVFQVLR